MKYLATIDKRAVIATIKVDQELPYLRLVFLMFLGYLIQLINSARPPPIAQIVGKVVIDLNKLDKTQTCKCSFSPKQCRRKESSCPKCILSKCMNHQALVQGRHNECEMMKDSVRNILGFLLRNRQCTNSHYSDWEPPISIFLFCLFSLCLYDCSLHA